MTAGDIINTVFNFRASTTYNAELWRNVSLEESENSTSFNINFEVGSANTGKVTVAGNTIKVANNGTTKPTAAQITGAGVSATDANKQDGWVLDGTKWAYTMGTSTGTLNSISDLANLVITANCTLSPVMKQNTYSVTLNGGKATGQTGFSNAATPVSASTYTTAVALGNPTWTGRSFVGWYTTQQSAVGATPGTNDKKINTNTAYNTINTTISSTADESTTSVTLYAWWNALTVPVKFNGNTPATGLAVNSVPANASVNYGDSYTITTTKPTANGYDFAGWATSSTGAVAYAAGATVPATALTDTTNGITLYAKWTEKTGYKVTFFANQTATADGTAHNTQSNLNWTGNVTVPSNPTAPAGYQFGGWYTTKNGTSANGNQMNAAMSYKDLLALVNSSATDSTKEIKMYAKWDELGKLTFTMNLNGSGATYNGTTNNYVKSDVLYNGSVSIPNVSNPSRTGYNFKGWSDTANGAANAAYVKNYTFNNVTANKTIYAVWEAAPVTLTYAQGPSGNLAGVTNKPAAVYTVNTKYDATVSVPGGTGMFDRNGYTFSNWVYAKASGTGTVAAGGGNLAISGSGISIVWTGSSEDGTLAGTAVVYPNWTAIPYTIKWDTQGGNSISNTTGLNGDSTINTPANPTRSGYTFQGWHTTSNGTGGKNVVTGNLLRDTWTLNATNTTVTAYAIWKEKIVEIRFFGDGSKAKVKQANNAGAASLTLYVGEATGALYSSASATTPGTGNINQGISPVVLDNHYEYKVYSSGNDANYTSKWTVGSPNGTTVDSSWVNTAGTLTIGQTGGLYVSADYYLTMSPKKYAYTIEYYNQNLADNNYSKVSNPSGSGTQFYGHTVTAGATAGASGTTLTVVPATQTGFTRNAAATGSVNSITIGDAAANNVLKFYYDRNTYTLTVNYSGDRPAGTNYSPATQTVKYGASVTLTNPTVPSGYNFTGWSATGITFGGSATPKNTFTMPASNLTVTGTWGIQTVNVSFKVGANGTINTASPNGAASQNKTFGSTMAAIPGVNVTNTNNYYFMGWALYKNCTTAGNETTGTLDRIYSPEEILGTGAYVGNAWTVPAGNSVFVARIMPTMTVAYVAGTGGAFTTINGTVSGTTVTTGGTYYAALPTHADSPMALPKYCVNTSGNRNAAGFDASGTQVRNANNPKAAAGYKFVGWTWEDKLNNATKTCFGYYNAAGVFTKVSGDDMPTAVNQSYTFTGVWEKTYQQLHFENTSANGNGVVGGAAPVDVCGQMGDNLAIPTAANYAPTNKPASAYSFKGWTTSTNYKDGDPLFNTTFQMTAGTQSTGVYTMPQAAADGGYGVTLYPVFEEKSVTINYALATGVTGVMGSLNKTSENIKMDSGSAAGSTATAKTGYSFKGWFADAAHTIPVATGWVSGTAITPAKGTGNVFAAATYYAYFEAEEYAITFKVGDHGTWQTPAGDKTDKTMNLAYNTTYGSNVPETKNDTGYGFKHWVDQNGATYNTNSVLSGTKITGPMTFTAIWEPRSGYTIVFDTNGGTPTLANKQVTWTANLNNSMDSSANNLKKQGYTFGGWYAKADCSDASKVVAADTFQTGIDKAGITVTGDTATLTLYAKWTANTYTISYNAHWPKTNPTTFADRSATWTDTNLLPSGGETLSMDGFTFNGWNTQSDGSGKTVTNLEALSELYVSLYGASDYSTTKTITLHALWDTKKFNVQFKDPSGTTLKTESNKNWDDAINYYTYTIADGSKRLLGWKYTPVGGTEQTWSPTTASKLVSEIGGDATSATDNKTYILTAILEDCTKYEIRFNKVNLNPDGSPNAAGATVVAGATKTGWTTPGVAIDIKNFNGQNYIDAFKNQNGAGPRADLKGYALDESFTGTKILATAAEVTSGGTIVFNVYWVEKLFNIEYQLGASSAVSGNKPYAGTDPAPAGKSAGWNSTNVMPDTTPTWSGYKAPVWQYQNASGNWVNVPPGAKVSDIARSDDNTQTIILKALWNTDQVRIIYAAQTGGSAKNADGSFTVAAGTSKNQDLDAVTGTPHTMTATAASDYTFVGWYKDGVLLTTNATMTPAKDGGLFQNSTYEARFRALGAIQYTIEHWFEGLDGTYAHDASKDATRSGQEFATINVTDDMKLNVKGFTFKSGVTGEKLTITSLVDGEILKLFYERNAHRVDVQAAKTDADQPTPLPTPTYTTTGITQQHTTQKYDTVLTLPTMTYDPSSWGFKWLVSFREPGTSTAADIYYNNGETFNMPDADVDIIGVWERKAHKVTFTNGDEPHGTVIVKNGKVLPFTVTHGKSMATDPDSSGNYSDIEPKADATWAWAGWEYFDENGAKLGETMDPDTVVINCDTTFKARWAQTFFVAYSPTAHGGAGFTSQLTVGRDIVINTPVTNYKLNIGGTDRTTDAPAAPGYRFVGWSWNLGDGAHYWITPTASDFDTTGLAGTYAEMTFPVTNNVTFEAIWEALEQDLSYKLDTKAPNSEWTGVAAGTTGDTFVVAPKPRTDQVVNLLTAADVTKAGHSFKGWAVWTDANGDGVIDESELGEAINGTYKMPAHAVVFVPVWDFESITINFQVASGSAGKGTLAPTQENITDDDLARLVGSVPTAAPGYVFAGWFTDDACNNPVDASWILSGDRLSAVRPADGWVSTTYFAKFVPGIAEYTIEFHLQNVDGTTYTLAEAPKFADINTEDFADVTDPANAAYGHLKTFSGYDWNQGKHESILRAEVKGDGSTVLKLYFDRKPFEITYDLLEGGVWAGVVGQSSAIADSTVRFPAVNRPGYEHDGWKISWTDPVTGETKTDEFGVNGSFTMPAAAVHAIATYIKYVDVIIEYYTDNADPANKIGEKLKPNAAKANTIYTLLGEDVRALRPGGYSNPATAPSMRVVDDPENPNVLKVIYVRIAEYKLKFDPNGGTGSAYIKGDLALGDTVAEYGPNNFKKTGYTQGSLPKRWNTAKDGSGLWITADTTYEEIAIALLGENYDDANLSKTVLTVYAIWFQNSYEVKYDLNNDMDKNAGILKPVPDWRNPMIVEDKKGVSWDSKGFNILSDEELDAAPAGYEFAGWNTAANGTGMTITDLTKYSEMSNFINKNVEQKSITLYAMWKEIIIKIEYVTDGGGTIDRVLDNVSAVTGQHVGQGSSAGNRLHSVATAKPGYHFIGWELYDAATHGALRAAADTTGVNAWHTIKNDDSELVVHDPESDGRLYAATYIARFAANDDASVVYDANGGEGQIDSTTVSHGLPVDLSDGTGFTRGHHTLVSWNTKEDGTGTKYELGTTGIVMPEGGMKLYAQWSVNSYDVHTGDRDDEIGKVVGGDAKVEWGKPLPPEYIAALSATAKPRSTFTGWRYTMVDADTGKTHTGVVQDLSELIVRGPLTIDAEFETEPAPEPEPEPYVSPVPKTGDERSMLPMLAIMMIAALAAIAGIIALFIARRREDETDEDELTAANGSQLVVETATAPVVAVRTIASGNRRMVLRRALAASLVAVCLCIVGFAPEIAFASTEGTGPTTGTRAAQSDPVTSSTGSFQSSGPKAGYVGHRDSPSSASASADKPQVAACGPAAAGTTSGGGSTAGYVGSDNSSTGINAANSATSAGASATSAQGAVKGGAVQYVTTTGPKAGYTGTYMSLSGPKAGYTGSSISMSGSKAGYLGSFNVVRVGEGSQLNTGTVTKGAVFVATPDTRATILSQLAHASSKSTIAKASSAYSASDRSKLGFGTLYYYIPKTSIAQASSSLSGACARYDVQARDLGSLGGMSQDKVAALADGRLLVDQLLNGASKPDASARMASAASVSDAIESRNKWMLSSISPSANVLGAACLLADLSGSLEGSSGALPTGSNGSVNAFPDMGEARLRDEDMVMGRIGLTPDVFADLFGEAQVTTSSLLLVDDGEALYVMPADDLSEVGDEVVEEPTEPTTPEKPGDGEEPTEPATPEKPGDGEEPTEPTTPENPDVGDENNGPNSYIIHFDSNGGKLIESMSTLQPFVYSNGSCSIPSYNDTLTRPGYSFLCWNTKANGSGVAIRHYEGITNDKLMAMFAENDLKDEDGANTRLYAQWDTLAADPTPPGDSSSPAAPTKPPVIDAGLSSSIVAQPSINVSQTPAASQTVTAPTLTAQSDAGAALAQVVRNSAAFGPANPIATVTSLLDVMSSGLGGLADALGGILDSPMITLDIAPVSSGNLVTVSNEVLAGVSNGQDGVGDVSPVVATQVVGAVATAVTLVVAAAAVTGSAMFSAGQASVVTAASAGAAGAAGAAAAGDAAAQVAVAAASRRRPIRRLRRQFRVSESQSAENASKATIPR